MLIYLTYQSQCKVAPHAGAWIEITLGGCALAGGIVAPHAGAWIEICATSIKTSSAQSRPTRARGLKSCG